MIDHLLISLMPELLLIGGAIAVLVIGRVFSGGTRGLPFVVGFAAILSSMILAWYSFPGEAPRTIGWVQLGHLAWYVRVVGAGLTLLVLLLQFHVSTQVDHARAVAITLFSLAGLQLVSVADHAILLLVALEMAALSRYTSPVSGGIPWRNWGFQTHVLVAVVTIAGVTVLCVKAGTGRLSGGVFPAADAWSTLAMTVAAVGLAAKVLPWLQSPEPVGADDWSCAAGSWMFFLPQFAGLAGMVKLLIFVQSAAWPDSGWSLPAATFRSLWFLSATAMVVPALIGPACTRLRSILTCASLSNGGVILMAVLVGPATAGGPLRNGVTAAFFGVVAFGVTSLAVMAVFAVLRVDGREVRTIHDLVGLSRRHPATALALTICVLSLIGLPLTGGFIGKLFAFASGISAGQGHMQRTPLMILAVTGVLSTVLTAAYCLRVVAVCYFGEQVGAIRLSVRRRGGWLPATACCLAVMVLGLWPTGLIKTAHLVESDILWHRVVRRVPRERGNGESTAVHPVRPVKSAAPGRGQDDIPAA